MKSIKLNGKTVVLTGASGGIGNAIAHTLAKAGYRLLLSGRDEAKLQSLANELSDQSAVVVASDLSDAEGRRQLLEAAEKYQADILINSIGTNRLRFLEDMTDADITEMTKVNLIVPMMICRGFVALLRQRDGGVIINVGSILGSIGYAGSSVYCSNKFGLRGFTESLRRELSDSSVRVVYFAPRATNTSLNTETVRKMNQALNVAVDEPEQVALRLIRVLNNPEEKTCYLGWPEAFFVRLNSVLPNLVDKALFKQLPIIRSFARENGSTSIINDQPGE